MSSSGLSEAPVAAPAQTGEAGTPGETELLLRRLTGSLAHNLNNRLTGVIGCLELALQELEPLSPLGNRLQLGLTCALQASEMVRRMVMFAFRPTGLPNTALVSLGEVAENAARRLREQHLPGMTIEVIQATTSAARANPVLVQLALDQLVDNAVEAMPEGGVLTLKGYDEGADVCLAVSDTGPGLAEQAAAHLFEPFVTTRTAGHLGLGLVLCRDLAEAQGGRLRLTWEAGRGATATLSFPAEHGVRFAPPSSSGQESQPPSSGALWHVI
jgi:signal transduction histidine kinase